MPHGDRSSWIQTYTNRQFWPMDPRPEDICIDDIAHALSNICRFTGHTREFYSVAQHSVIVSRMVPSEDARWGLMHDAAEAYLADIARPVKRSLPAYKIAEAKLEECIAQVFALPRVMPASVKIADNVVLAMERRDLLPHRSSASWVSLENVEACEEIIVPLDCKAAKRVFIDRFVELFGGIR